MGNLINEFIEYKTKNGYAYATAGYHLQKYLVFSAKHSPSESIPSRETVQAFLNEYGDTPGNLYNIAAVLRELSRYLIGIGYPSAYIIPPEKISLPAPIRPYLFTDGEIEAFFATCDRLPYDCHVPKRHIVLPAMYRLHYCCGLRCKETRTLKIRNVHLDSNYIDILQSKGPKSRRVFISQELSVKDRLQSIRGDEFITWQNYHDDLGLYVMSFTEQWDYHEKQPRTGMSIEGKRRVYLHFYYNDQRCADDRLSFTRLLTRLQDELKSGARKPEHEKLYSKYFTFSDTPKRGLKIEAKQDAINDAQKNFGYFVLMSNGVKDPVEAIKIYRTKDLIEKSFGNLKERLDMRRMSVASEENFEGKLFIQFIALMYLSYIKKQMDDHGLFKNYSMQTMLDDLDIIERYQQPGKSHHLSEITRKQAVLYEAMGVSVPS